MRPRHRRTRGSQCPCRAPPARRGTIVEDTLCPRERRRRAWPRRSQVRARPSDAPTGEPRLRDGRGLSGLPIRGRRTRADVGRALKIVEELASLRPLPSHRLPEFTRSFASFEIGVTTAGRAPRAREGAADHTLAAPGRARGRAATEDQRLFPVPHDQVDRAIRRGSERPSLGLAKLRSCSEPRTAWV